MSSSQLSYWDTNLDPGYYCYDITAVYDLTNVGFPGQEAESAKDGPACLGLDYGHWIPFYENWISGTFTLNEWTPGENWVLDGQAGNSAPSAKFNGDPMLTNYSSPLESSWIDGAYIYPTVPFHIWLDFDLKLDELSASGNEKLTTEIWNDTTWVPIGEFSNSVNLDWTTEHLDITNQAKYRTFRFRFNANGENSGDIHYWYVDNIQVYYEYEFSPPFSLTVDLTGNPANDMHLVWQVPIGSGTIKNYLLDDNTAENGFAINPGEDAWLGNEFSVSDAGNLKSVDVYWQANSDAGNEPMTIDIFDAGRTLIGSSDPFIPVIDNWQTITLPDIPFIGTFYAMVHWNMLSSQSNYFGSDENGPNAPANYGWYYDGSAWSHLSDFGYNPNVFLIRAKALLSGDWSVKTNGVPLPDTYIGAIPKNYLAQSGHGSIVSNNKYISSSGLGDISQGVLGYNIYRRQYLDPGPGQDTTLSDWSIIANVTDNEYLDQNLFNNCYFYKVTALYSEGESLPSNTEEGCIPSGLPETPVEGINLFPNPAISFVNIDHSGEICFLSIVDEMGSVVGQMNTAHEFNIKLDVAHYATGVYTLRFTMMNGTLVGRKLVVIR